MEQLIKKSILKSIFLISLIALFSGCDQSVDLSNPNSAPDPIFGSKADFIIPDIVNDETYKYDRTKYNHFMDEAFDASKEFVNESIKASMSGSSRAAYIGVSEDDKWQSKMTMNGMTRWNVPTNIYGTDYNTSNNKLVVNGEDLGTLQNIIFYQDDEGHYTKGVFGYKGKLYYIYDKSKLDGKSQFEVLSKTDPDTPPAGKTAIEEIVVDREKYTSDNSDFSEFYFWKWDRDLDGKLVRYGNQGYAYTVRNVRMLDGSYATVTISCLNYWYYGFRVWIKEQTDNNASKKEYPDLVYTPPLYEPRVDLKDHLKENNYDFVYKIENNSKSDSLKVTQFLASAAVRNLDRAIITKIPVKTLDPGESVEFKYNFADLLSSYNYIDLYLGSFFELGNRGECGTWSVGISEGNRNHQYTVIIKDPDTHADWKLDDENFLTDLELPDDGKSFLKLYDGDDSKLTHYIQIDLSGMSAELANTSYLTVQRREKGGDWEGVIDYNRFNGNIIDPNQLLIDYFVKPNTKYFYRLNYNNITDNNDWKTTRSYSITAEKGDGLLSITPGSATFNNEDKTLKVTSLPKYFIPSSIELNGFDTSFLINYQFTDNSGSLTLSSRDIESRDIDETRIIDLNKVLMKYDDPSTYFGKELRPSYYLLFLQKFDGDTAIRYAKFCYDVKDLPNITMPSEISYPDFLKLNNGFPEIYLSNCSEYLNNSNLSISRKAKNAPDTEWNYSIYLYDNDSNISDAVKVTDYFVEPYKEYTYRVSFGYFFIEKNITPTKGYSEFSFKPGKATYNSANSTIVFSEPPVYGPKYSSDNPAELQTFLKISYMIENSYNSTSFYYESDTIDIIQQLRNWNDSSLLGKTLSPNFYDVSAAKEEGDLLIQYIASFAPTGLPVVTFPDSIPE